MIFNCDFVIRDKTIINHANPYIILYISDAMWYK